jgi:hypothetical protein
LTDAGKIATGMPNGKSNEEPNDDPKDEEPTRLDD